MGFQWSGMESRHENQTVDAIVIIICKRPDFLSAPSLTTQIKDQCLGNEADKQKKRRARVTNRIAYYFKHKWFVNLLVLL